MGLVSVLSEASAEAGFFSISHAGEGAPAAVSWPVLGTSFSADTTDMFTAGVLKEELHGDEQGLVEIAIHCYSRRS